MAERLLADASPEKRLFISLLTRDISLAAAFLDLIDNSINAAVEPYSERLKTAADYQSTLNDEALRPTVDIILTIEKSFVSITDTAHGISAKVAQEHVFKFGRGAEEHHDSDRLSVYGIGLKRAIFKLGNNIAIRSNHEDGGFDLKLKVNGMGQAESKPLDFSDHYTFCCSRGKSGYFNNSQRPLPGG